LLPKPHSLAHVRFELDEEDSDFRTVEDHLKKGTKVCLFLEICKGGIWIFSAKMVYKVFRGFRFWVVQVTKQDAICRVSKPLLERLDILQKRYKNFHVWLWFSPGSRLDKSGAQKCKIGAQLHPDWIPTGSMDRQVPTPAPIFPCPHPPLPLFSFSAHQPCTNTPLLLHQNGISQMGVLQSPN
jgi:hypothetical protein